MFAQQSLAPLNETHSPLLSVAVCLCVKAKHLQVEVTKYLQLVHILVLVPLKVKLYSNLRGVAAEEALPDTWTYESMYVDDALVQPGRLFQLSEPPLRPRRLSSDATK